ncbi:MAG: transcriptional regulator, LacI family, partial [Chloroflexi bacterium]|nr:transcriptional regulator, LacI family [Chloroflexota bacterium]
PAEALAGSRKLLSLCDPPTAVFAANDHLALSVIEVLREHGRRIPEDVAVLGFDDVPLSQELVPPLSTVRIPFTDLGRQAADILLQIIRDKSAEHIAETVPLELIRRGTA